MSDDRGGGLIVPFVPKVDQLSVFGLRDPVAISRQFFEPCPIKHLDDPALRFDKPITLQNLQVLRHARASATQHERQKLVGQRDFIAVCPVTGHEQPPGEALVDGETAKGQGRVGYLDRYSVQVTKEHPLQHGAVFHRIPEIARCHAQGRSCDLHKGQVRRAVHVEEDDRPSHALPTDIADFKALISGADCHHGRDALFQEVDVLDELVGLHENVADV